MNGPIFQKFPKFEQNWLKFKNSWVILLKVWPKIEQIGRSLFLEKLVFVWVYFQIPRRHLVIFKVLSL